MKKFFSVIMAVLLCLTLCVPAFAARIAAEKRITAVLTTDELPEPTREHKHTFKENLTAEPTCTKNGAVLSVCIVCGVVRQEFIPALGHDVYRNEDYIAPSCCSQGFGGGVVCLRCGVIFEDPDVIPAVGHIDIDEDGICDVCGGDPSVNSEPADYHPIVMRNIITRILEIFRAIFGN